LKEKIEKKIIKKNKDEIKIQRIRTEIEKQQTNRTIMYFSYYEREKKEKTKTIDHSR
jgi:hypothetical protein